MKKLYSISLVLLCLITTAFAQTNNVLFFVGGDATKYYPVKFADANWNNNKETVIEIGRSAVHTDVQWHGSLMSKFSYHTTNYGHRSNYIDAQVQEGSASFIGGWADGTRNNAEGYIWLWLRGGTTYALNSESNITPVIYDGVQNPLPVQETNGPIRNFLTQPEPYVANYTIINDLSAYYLGAGNNYFNGNVGIGTLNPTEKLSVKGKIRAQEIKVETANWPDYVFEEGYQIGTLEELESYIKVNKHLPDFPSAKEVTSNGVELGEMVKQLLKTQEKLTLQLIEQNKQIKLLNQKLENISSKKTKSNK